MMLSTKATDAETYDLCFGQDFPRAAARAEGGRRAKSGRRPSWNGDVEADIGIKYAKLAHGVESPTKEAYEVSLDPKGEVIKYRDDVDVYYFSLRRQNEKWIVYLPATKGEPYRRYELTEEEQKVIFPRIRNYLEAIKYFVLFGRYPVIFKREAAISPEI